MNQPDYLLCSSAASVRDAGLEVTQLGASTALSAAGRMPAFPGVTPNSKPEKTSQDQKHTRQRVIQVVIQIKFTIYI